MLSPALARLALAAACLVGLPGLAVAQQPAEFDSWQMPGWSFAPGMSIGMERDTNITLAASDDAAEAPDSIFRIEPFGSLEFLSRRTTFSTGYRGYARRNVQFEELNGFDHRLHAQLRHQATKRVLMIVSNDYADLPTTDEVVLTGGLPFSRAGSQSNAFSGAVEAQLTKFTNLKSGYEVMWIDFEKKEETELSGGWVNAVRNNVERRITARGSVGAEYSVRFAELNAGTSSMRFHDVGATASYALGANTTLSGAVGYSHLSDRSEQQTRSAPYFRFELTRQVRTTTAGIGYERSFVPAFGFGGSTASQDLRAFVHVPIPNNRTYLQASGTWRRSVPYLANELELNAIVTHAMVGYAFTRWLRVEGFHSFSRQDPVVSGRGEIERHRIGAQMVISQPMRLQ